MPADSPEWLMLALGAGTLLGAAVARSSCCTAEPPPPARAADAPSNLPPAAIEIAPHAVALVTGASPGTMGGSICEALAAAGCSIAAVEHPLRLAQCEELCRSLRT